MIRRNTWVVLVVLVALVGFSVYFTKHKTQQAASGTATPPGSFSASLFSSGEGSVTGISIKDSTGQSVEFARNEAGTWVLKAPTATGADQAGAEAAATQVGSLRVLSSPQLGLDVVGLDKPAYVMVFTFDKGKTHTLKVGAVTPIQDGYYSILDGGTVRIVDKQGLDALIQLLTQPPYAMTLTPTAAPTSTPELPTATPEITGTPVPATSGSPAPTATP